MPTRLSEKCRRKWDFRSGSADKRKCKNNLNCGGNAEPQKSPNIFQQFVLAFVPTKYDRLTRVKVGSMISL